MKYLQAFFVTLFLIPTTIFAQALSIYTCDVGQGDGIIITTSAGNSMLIDGGQTIEGKDEILAQLSNLGINNLDYIIASNYDPDHIGNIPHILYSGISVDTVFDRGNIDAANTITYSEYVNSVSGVRHNIQAGQVIDMGAGVTVTCVVVNGRWSQSDSLVVGSESERSIGLLIEYNSFKLFTAGDLEKAIEDTIGTLIGNISLLKAGNHGSEYSSSAFFLSQTNPEAVLISVSSYNLHNYPSPATLARMDNIPDIRYIYQTTPGNGGTSEKVVVLGTIVTKVYDYSFTIDDADYSPGIIISDDITENTTWTEANSPYYITETIKIYPDVTLTIEPGVIVRLDYRCLLEVDGELIAIGTKADNIYFIRNKINTGWGAIKFLDSSIDASYDDTGKYLSGSIIKYSRIEGARISGIFCESASPFIYKNTITGNFGYNAYYGGGGGICCANSTPIITGNTISHNITNMAGGGIYCYDSSPIISENIISHNSGRVGGGIYCTIPATIFRNTISNNSAAFRASGGGIELSYDLPDITNISYNNILNNRPYDVTTGSNLEASNNWWGTIVKDSIDAHISDWYKGTAIYEPFLLSATPIIINSIELKTDNTYSADLSADLITGDTLYIELVGKDGDLTTLDNTDVLIKSTSDTIGISVKLSETYINSGTYRGIALSQNSSNNTTGVIGTSPGDIIKIFSIVDALISDSVVISKTTSVELISESIPAEYSLFQNYPNPFNPVTTIEYKLRKSAPVLLRIYNILGQELETLVNEKQQTGRYKVMFDASKYTNGIYFYHIQVGEEFQNTKKMILLK